MDKNLSELEGDKTPEKDGVGVQICSWPVSKPEDFSAADLQRDASQSRVRVTMRVSQLISDAASLSLLVNSSF
jgi:hypothetical protein